MRCIIGGKIGGVGTLYVKKSLNRSSFEKTGDELTKGFDIQSEAVELRKQVVYDIVEICIWLVILAFVVYYEMRCGILFDIIGQMFNKFVETASFL